MTRFALLTLAVALLSVPVGAERAITDGVPLMKGELKILPGTVVPITLPARPRPCAPIANGELSQVPGVSLPLLAPDAPCYAPIATGDLTALPGTGVPVDPPRLPEPRKR